MYSVKEITRNQYAEYILQIHYAHRFPSITYAYGLFLDNQLCGVVTYGTPPSSNLRRGVAGDKYIMDVLELNRLVLRHNRKNEASMLVGQSLKMIPYNRIIVSFADISNGHIGYVYQACNFIYTGLSAKRTDWKVKGREHLHSYSIADEFRGRPDRGKLIRAKYGEDFYMQERPRKHRYLYIKGDRRYKKEVLRSLRYAQEAYPKGESHV